MAKRKRPKGKYIKFIGKRKKKKRQQRNDNIFTSDFYPEYKWGLLVMYEYYLAPFYKKKIIGVNRCITKLKKDAKELDFTKRWPMMTFETWAEAKKYFNQYKRKVSGDLEISE